MSGLRDVCVLCIAFLIAWPVWGEEPPPYPEVKSKRIKPPKPGAKKRITVQIRSQPGKPAVVVDPSAPPKAPTAAQYAWYWQKVSPALDAAGQRRFEDVLTALSQGPKGQGVTAPRLQHMQQIMSRHGVDILKSTIGTQVSPALVLAVIGIESAGRTDAVSVKGATGLMQLMPATAERFGVSDRADPAQNIRGGVAYLNWLMSEFDRDPILVLAAYNAGENAVRGNKGVPPYAETRDYVPKVLAAWTVARGLCRTPPELISDGCAFLAGASN